MTKYINGREWPALAITSTETRAFSTKKIGRFVIEWGKWGNGREYGWIGYFESVLALYCLLGALGLWNLTDRNEGRRSDCAITNEEKWAKTGAKENGEQVKQKRISWEIPLQSWLKAWLGSASNRSYHFLGNPWRFGNAQKVIGPLQTAAAIRENKSAGNQLRRPSRVWPSDPTMVTVLNSPAGNSADWNRRLAADLAKSPNKFNSLVSPATLSRSFLALFRKYQYSLVPMCQVRRLLYLVARPTYLFWFQK